MTREDALGHLGDAPPPVREAVMLGMTEKWSEEALLLRSQGLMIAALRETAVLPHYTLCDYRTAVKRVGIVMDVAPS